MKLIDISMTISKDMMVYKDRVEKKPKFMPMKTYENSDFYESRMDIDLHTGTHVDAPLHMIENGKTMDQLALEDWHGEAQVLDLSHVKEAIHLEDINSYQIKQGEIILLKTQNSFEETFNADFIYLAADAAAYLAESGVKGVGIDALGIERAQAAHETHKILFDQGCFILEGLRLAHVKEGHYYLMALPLNIVGVEASPVRAVLVEK
jgi:arylformamidase